MNELEARTERARQALDDIEATLATLNKLVKDIEPSYCTDTDLAVLDSVAASLDEAEAALADLCADHNEQAEESEPILPFDAWDLIAHERCRVIGWYDRTHYRLASGTIARLDSVAAVFPAWLADAEQALADARDEADTERCALDVGVQ